jgi:membrane peptidoglycan carboxypeptidase
MRTATTLAKVTSLLGAFLAISVLMGLIGAGLLLPLVGSAGSAAREGVGMFEELPGDLESNPLAQQSRIEAANGDLIATPAQENRIIVELDQIAEVMQLAQVAIEDERYYEHGGVDLQGLGRAFVTNATTDDTQGGSTLTQQYVKLSLQEEARQKGDSEALVALQARSGIDGYVRKLREMKYAVTLEDRLTKDEILEGYLNLAYYGDRTYGVEAASRHYFGVRASELNLPQAALLAGVVRAPGVTDPVNNPEAAVARRNVVLDRMYDNEMISEKAYREARESELELNLRDSQRSCLNSAHPYFCDYVTEWLLQSDALGATRDEREATLTTGGLTITTTLDPELSQLVRETTREFTPQENEYLLGSAVAMVEPGTGKVLAIGQSSDYALQESEDRLTATSVNWSVDGRYGGSSGFHIGSIAKAFSIIAALERGTPVETNLAIREPETVDSTGAWLENPDDPVTSPEGSTHPAGIFFPEDFESECTIGEEYWSVRNAEDANHDPLISLRRATAASVNTAFATMATQVGTCNIRDTMSKMGLTSADGDAFGAGGAGVPPTFVLGSDNASPLTVANSYATIASGGLYCPPVPVEQIVDSNGEEIPIPVQECEQVIDEDVAAGAAELMQEVVSLNGSGFRAVLDSGQPAGGKTGTADESKHTWFAGYTPQVSTAVWIGSPGEKYDGNLRDIRLGDYNVEGQLYGSKLAAPMWKVLMEDALQGVDVQQFDEPSQTMLEGEQRTVPDVSGLQVDEAQDELADAGLAGTAIRVASGSPEGTVLYTSPGAGSRTRSGDPLEMFVSGGQNAPPPSSLGEGGGTGAGDGGNG